MADKPRPEPEWRDGPTPNGGAYSIAYTHDDGSIEIVEFSADDRQIMRTYFPAPRRDPTLTD